MPSYSGLFKPVNLIFLLLLFLIFFNPLVVVKAGERGILMVFGKVQTQVLGEGLHFIIPVAQTVQKINVRIQKQEISAEASSKDLQEVFTDVALNWHIIPEEANLAFQQIGDEQTIIEAIINPVIEEILKAVMAKYTAEEIITRRENVKSEVDNLLTGQLINYHIQVDNISLVHVHFSQRFMDAVEAKQIAEQDAKKAGFLVLKAIKEAEVKVNLAKGEAEANAVLQKTLTPQILKRQMVDQWNGKLPLVWDDKSIHRFNLDTLVNH
ncbi:prohibitin family protein [Planktothrix paucivesiculata]|uniref:Band 7 protein n=1 Tax=Planktothrix paucivesiculata PCC 9631 TaxID=671071 RepID=A0A7Z9E1R2_9CYAN|nr:prohibitin family protein [Planktothrix paucivesiculata]VXD21745.1 Band 7 protein [Planktothrix paucivesiculata PCC 9631]